MEESKLDPMLHTVFRLDGHGFSHLVKSLKLDKPFDDRFTESMKHTLITCINTFNFSLGFVGSDEISYYLKPLTPEQLKKESTLPFSGRIQKMISLLAGKVSVVFCTEMAKLYGPEVVEYLPHFDCRVFQFKTFEQVLENLSERVVFTLKNARLMLGQQYYSQKQLLNLPSNVVASKLKDEKGIDFNECVKPDNRVGNILLFETKDCEKEIEFKTGEKKLIKYQRNYPVLHNMSPKDVLGIVL